MGRIVIAGGGIIGLFTAYSLLHKGHHITVIDKGDLNNNCSTGNAGMIVPSHIIPLASPGVVAKGLKWMLSAKSPFYINPRLDPDLIRWAWKFYRSSNKIHVDNSLPHLKNIGQYSKDLYQRFVRTHHDHDFFWREKGLLLLYRTSQGEKEEMEAAAMVQSAGLQAELLSWSQIKDLEPAVHRDVKGGVMYPDDALLSPAGLLYYLRSYLEKNDVDIVSGQSIQTFGRNSRRVYSVKTEEQHYECDYLVIAAGAWSASLSKLLSVKIPMRAGKGYSYVSDNYLQLRQPAILSEKKVTVSPYGRHVRFGGTMEITGLSHKISPLRVQGIAESIGLYYSGYTMEMPALSHVWSGLRPVSPDGMPYIGISKSYDNVLFATGHSMMGVSLAPATGQIIADLVGGIKPPFPIDAFSPDRF
jgi:D-amino-acid dehydrogenase